MVAKAGASPALQQTPPASTAAQTGAPQQAAPQPPPDKPFAEIIKDAEVIQGLFTIYRKDDKVYLEIMPEQFGQIYLLSPTMESGLGERGFFGAQVLEEFAFAFQKIGKSVQLVRKNVHYKA
ncbi:MAG: DUF5118 domain-containing protein, partial [Pyrinomonadaceae bacterium]